MPGALLEGVGRAFRAERAEVADRGDELRVLRHWRAQQFVKPGNEFAAPELGVRVHRPLGALAVADRLDRLDPAVAGQGFHGVVERAGIDLEAVVLVALAQRGGHFVGVHRPFQQQAEQGKGQGVRDLPLHHQVVAPYYSEPTIRQASRGS